MLRSSSVPVPLRVLALLIVVSALVLATLAPALASSHPAANDGQRLEDQPADVQATYRAVYGDDAEARWIAEHNAAIGATMDSMDDMMMSPSDNMYYDRIIAVATARGAGDMDPTLPARIAADVISRGTEMAFLEGTDAGVLYGIGRSEADINMPAPAPAASSGGGGGGAAPAPAPDSGMSNVTDWADLSQYLAVGQRISITLPESTHPSTDSYAMAETTGTLAGVGLTFSPATRTITGVAGPAGSFTGTYSAVDTTPADVGEPYVMTVTLSIRAADLQPRFAIDASIPAVWHLEGAAAVTEAPTFPEIVPGTANGTPTYSVSDRPAGVTFDASTRVLTVGTTTDVGVYSLTYVATDEDGDSASLPLTVTVEEDVEPVAPDIADFSIVVGSRIDRFLPLATGGNGDLTYSLSDLPTGVTGPAFVPATRWWHGVVTYTLPDGVDAQTFTFTYTVTEVAAGGGDTDSDTFRVTLTRS